MPAAAAITLAAAAVGAGPVAALLASPIAIGLGLVAVAAGGDEIPEPLPHRLAGTGAAASVLAALLLARGPWAVVVPALGLGLACVALAGVLSLRVEPPSKLDRGKQAARLARGARLHNAVVADLLVRAAWELGAWLRSTRPRAEVLRRLEAAERRDARVGWADDPRRAHPPPPALEHARVRNRELPGLGRFETLEFESEFEPVDPEIRVEYLALRANRRVRVHLWRGSPDADPRPVLVCLHGLGLGWVGVDAWRWGVRWLQREVGLDVALLVLPLHGPRARAGLSGAGFFEHDPLWTRAALGQSVWDARRLLGWLRRQGAPAVGLFGQSLGGGIAALLAALDPDLACVIAMNPALSLARLWWQHRSVTRLAGRRADPLTLDRIERLWEPWDALRLAPLAPRAGRCVVYGVADRLVPPAQALALWERWEHPRRIPYAGSHVARPGASLLRRPIGSHLRETLLANPPPSTPPLSRFRF